MKNSKGKSKKPVPMTERVLQLVCSRPETSVSLAVLRLGRYVSEAQAAACGHRRLRSRNSAARRGKDRITVRETVLASTLAEWGRRNIVSEILSQLTRQGKIVRLRRGVYGPPPPKLHQPVAV